MGIISAIKGLLSAGEKGGKVVDTGLDLMEKAASGIDAMFYTDEEKATNMAKNADTIIAHALAMNKLMNEGNTLSSRIRRTLAYSITYTVLGSFIWCVLVLSWAYFVSEKQDVINRSKQFVADVVATGNALYIGGAFTAVCILFFGYYGLNKVIASKKE